MFLIWSIFEIDYKDATSCRRAVGGAAPDRVMNFWRVCRASPTNDPPSLARRVAIASQIGMLLMRPQNRFTTKS